ncbi:hypothetical protein [Gallibacterium anatis]|uniref:hypothetical protein n=1 Tax=Gallibacterium anatis TaxID=750 RepID=UPI000531157A|nr:hypothetical protein [Gallibacterium anatis]KGQ40650.1 UDP-N-acetylglucosamine acyltransferase [Gallibacterium anatis IPDH697-78]MDK9560950.1 UDP-N-acetylglucosamine acyltransferase [Gallibacterium anatis]
MKKLLCLIFSIFALNACTAPANLNFVPEDGLEPVNSSQKINAEIKAITISNATKADQKGDIQTGIAGNQYEQSFKMTFKDALEEALSRVAIFRDDAPTKLTLVARVLKFDSPGMNTESKTYMITKYDFIDRNTGKTIYSTEINSLGSVPLSYAFLGTIRITEGRNRAVRENINHLITELKSNKFIK